MGSQTLSILRQGIWASLTGGWYYDPKQSHFSNVFHLYLWLVFLTLPFVIQIGTSTLHAWVGYCTAIGLLFSSIKFVNAYLHRLFDYGECVVEDTSSHKSDDEINLDEPVSLSRTEKVTVNQSNEQHEHIEMVVLGKNETDKTETTDNTVLSQNSVNNSSNNNNNDEIVSSNAKTSTSFLNASISGTNPSVIDLEVDVHHRNSSGSSIGLSEKGKTCKEEHGDSRKNDGQNKDTLAGDNNILFPPHISTSMNLSTESTAIEVNCERELTKGTSLELGFMAQDPGAMRAREAEAQTRGKRNEPIVVRRARSELETAQCIQSDKKVSSLPPSHPVSLEIIRTVHSPDDDSIGEEEKSPDELKNSCNSFEVIRKTSNSLNENIKPNEEELATHEVGQQAKDDVSLKAETVVKDSPVLSDHRTQSVVIVNQPETSQTNIRSTDDDGDESDVSLVVSNKNKKRKTPKGVKRKPVNRRRVSKSTSLGKIQSLNRKSADKLMSGDAESSKCCVHYSSDSDIESSHNESDCCSSSNKPSTSLSSSNSSTDEKTPLTSFATPKELRTNTLMTLEPKCLPGPSRGYSEHETRRKTLQTFGKGDTTVELRRLRSEIQKTKQTRIKTSISSQTHELSESNEPMSLMLSNSLESSGMASAENGPPPYLLARILSVPGTHLARSHEDTNPGAVHVFQDERGNWLTYTFDENSTGVARGLMNSDKALIDFDRFPSLHRQSFDSTSSGSTVVLDTPRFLHTPKLSHSSNDYSRIMQSNANSLFAESFPITAFPRVRTNRRFEVNANLLYNHHAGSALNNSNIQCDSMYPMRFADFSPDQPHKPKQYYKLWILPFKAIKVHFDRLTLLALLDRSLTLFELLISIILAVLVAVFGSILLHKGFFHDLWLFVFCLVIASSHYTLIKSVQPDASSPTHGYNRVTLYSRPIYFCLSSMLLLLSQFYLDGQNKFLSFVIYGRDFLSEDIIKLIRDANIVFLLSFPVLFSFGLLPQISTFLMYFFEQIDVHFFGGTAVTGLVSSIYCIIRSICLVSFLYGCALIAFQGPFVTQNVTSSIFCGLLIACCYHVSRGPSDPSTFWNLIKRCLICNTKQKCCDFKMHKPDKDKLPKEKDNNQNKDDEDSQEHEITDPLPMKLEQTTLTRLHSDLIICIFIVIVVFATHVSTIFTLQPYVEIALSSWAVTWGFLFHYLMNHFRKQLPWLCFANPVMKPKEYNQYEVKGAAKVMWFEKIYVWMWLIEKNIIYQLVFLSAISNDAPLILDKFGFRVGLLILVVCGFKCIRSTFNDPSHNYIILLFTYLFFNFDLASIAEPFLINYFVLSIAYTKFYELLLKVRFIITYVAPWQITWGSAFHAFAQPFSVPHSSMLFVQAVISSILSAPLQPILGSAIFFVSYVRPIKFWERDYNTKRVDHSNTRLASQLERVQLGADDNNLNSIFYEHLTRSLQHSLYGDLVLGRWGSVSQGDCFVLASDNLNCLVHIIELGNGLVTFQVRGLEFRGTYCQQREVEAISEGVSEDEGCCCCEPGHLPGTLSINAAFNQRWLAWEVTHTKYVLEGYSISDNSASTMLQPYDLRKALITYYIKSLIYYCITSSSLEKWIEQKEIRAALETVKDPNYVDLDPIFNISIDEDYDFRLSGITKASFCQIYLNWINYCIEQRNKEAKSHMEMSNEKEALLVSLCFNLSLLARRALSAASHHNSFASVEFLLYGLHSLFKGDFRITSSRDEWVFQDINLIRKVIAPSVRMALRLHQDHFMSADEYDDNAALFESIKNYQNNLVISHEADPVWRNAVLSNVPSLLALRHVFDDGTDQYKIIQLNRRFLSFRVIKINRECVRGLWAGQQQELIYLRNRNPERGSIQNAKQALRNIINSSCDQPIGYPIFVSPLTTSFLETSDNLTSVIGSPLSFGMFKRAFLRCWERIRKRCGEGCSSGQINSQDSCHRIDTFTFERAAGTRSSNLSDASTDYDSNQYLCRRSRTQHPYSYRHKFCDKNSPLQSSTVVNLTSFRSTQGQSTDLEIDSLLLHKSHKSFASTKGEPV